MGHLDNAFLSKKTSDHKRKKTLEQEFIKRIPSVNQVAFIRLLIQARQ